MNRERYLVQQDSSEQIKALDLDAQHQLKLLEPGIRPDSFGTCGGCADPKGEGLGPSHVLGAGGPIAVLNQAQDRAIHGYLAKRHVIQIVIAAVEVPSLRVNERTPLVEHRLSVRGTLPPSRPVRTEINSI